MTVPGNHWIWGRAATEPIQTSRYESGLLPLRGTEHQFVGIQPVSQLPSRLSDLVRFLLFFFQVQQHNFGYGLHYGNWSSLRELLTSIFLNREKCVVTWNFVTWCWKHLKILKIMNCWRILWMWNETYYVGKARCVTGIIFWCRMFIVWNEHVTRTSWLVNRMFNACRSQWNLAWGRVTLKVL